MRIKTLEVSNFKAFQEVTIHFHEKLNILTGINNSGKTIVLEAIALWHECFSRSISEVLQSNEHYERGDFIFESSNKFIPFKSIQSVQSPNFEDNFHHKNIDEPIRIAIKFQDVSNDLAIAFTIKSFGNNYVIELENPEAFDYRKFNRFFKNLPAPFSLLYSNPTANILTEESFTTEPIIRKKTQFRQSTSVLRNRLYKLMNRAAFEDFIQDLNYILYNSTKAIELQSRSNIQQDTNVIIEYRIGARDTFKDLALLGSGTLQIIEILLNLYNPLAAKYDLKFVLLDEPDSHIHRDIQARLIESFIRFSGETQIFLTSHNESLIRSATPEYIFHFDGRPRAEIDSIQINPAQEHRFHL